MATFEPHLETHQVVAVMEALVVADATPPTTTELTAAAGLLASQDDTVRRIGLELAAQGWVWLSGTGRLTRYTLGFRLGAVAWAGRQTLLGRAPRLEAVEVDLRAPPARSSHVTTAAIVAAIQALCGTPQSLGTHLLATAMGVGRNPARRILGQLAQAEWVTHLPRPEGDAWRPGPRFFQLAARHSRFLRAWRDRITDHLSLVESS